MNCPICKSALMLSTYDTDWMLSCDNTCYSQSNCFGIMHISVFGRRIEGDNYTEIIKEIEYWKENDRYLINILGGLK